MTMKRFISYALAASVLALLSACSSTRVFPSQVTVFSDWPGDAAAKSYTFTRSAEQQTSLEHKTYENAVREALASKGFNEMSGTSGAKYKVALSYGVNADKTRHEVVVDDYYPYWRPYIGFGYWGRRWGGWGSFPIVYPTRAYGYEYPIYNRELKIEISEAASGAKRYEATARNDSRYDTITTAVPYLARAALDGFPLVNGSVRVVKIPLPEVSDAPAAPAKDMKKEADKPAPK